MEEYLWNKAFSYVPSWFVKKLFKKEKKRIRPKSNIHLQNKNKQNRPEHYKTDMADKPQNVFNEGHICDQFFQRLIHLQIMY